MTDQNETPFGTAFTVSVEAREGVSTGISAHDRAHTIQVAIDPSSTAFDLVQPGHVFPLRHAPAACCSARARPRLPSTSRGSPASPRRESSARS